MYTYIKIIKAVKLVQMGEKKTVMSNPVYSAFEAMSTSALF